MIAKIIFTGALFLRLLAPVAAMPNFFGRAESCTATLTVTIYSSIDESPSPSSSSPKITSSALGVSPGSGPVTVTVVDTITIVSTVYASPSPGVQITGSPNSGGPHTVTVMVTNVFTSVETKTVVQTQTITQERTIVQTQTVTQTLTQASSVQTDVDVELNEDPDGPSVTYTTVTSTFTTTNTIFLSPGTGVPPQPFSRPLYSNGTETGTYSNLTKSSFAKPSSPTTSLNLLDLPPESTTAPLASDSSSSPPSYANVSSSNYENALYFVNWGIYGANFQPQSLPASEITRVNYAFADIQSDGTVVTSDSYADLEKHYPTDSWGDVNSTSNAYGCVKQLYLLKKQNRNMKVLLSIGGWTYSSKFSPVAADATTRQTFATSAVALVTDWGFDGVDIDWEFNAYAATAADRQNIVLLLQALRAAFDAWSASYAPAYHFLVTVASPAGPATYQLWDLAAMDPYVDAWNLMAYDYAGAWDTAASAHAANLYPLPANPAATPYNTDQAVTAYIQAGVAPAKLLLGLPLYGRSFEGTAGLGQPYSGVGPGDGLAAGEWRFKNLPRAGATEYYDTVARATYSYDSATAELISYDNVQSTTAKSQYLMSRGLGGAMFWEASDDKNGSDSLVATMAGLLGSLDRAAENLLDYPTSKWDNIRNGMPDS